MKFRPSIRTETIKLLFFIFLTTIFYIVTIYIELPKTTYFIYQEYKFNYFLLGFLLLNSINFLQFLSSIMKKITNEYKIVANEKTLYYKNGLIFKERESIDIKEIRKIMVFQPNIFQLITNIRTIGIEADGVDGWDIYLHNVKNWKKIEKTIIRIKNN